ncbi:MAG: Cof-type HAD-IIB family hydrolase [Brevinema sp.]
MEIRKNMLHERLTGFDSSKIKAVAIDIDGTLINSKGSCSPRIIKTIQKLKDSGREVFLVTGRGVCTAMPYAKEVDIPKYMINYNGAVIYNMQDENKDYEICIDEEISREILKIARENKLFTVLYSDDIYYYEFQNEESESFVERVRVEGYLKNFDDLDIKKFQKFLISLEKDQVQTLEKELNEKFGDKLNIVQTSPGIHSENEIPRFYLEIMHKDANKGLTLTRLLDKLNISLDEAVAFGDDKNDIEMLQTVKWGIAMGNARPAVREATPYMTLTNDEDGVAYFIEKYILEEDV